MMSVDDFEFDTGWLELLKPTTRVVLVKVRGLEVKVPPKESRWGTMSDDPKRREPKVGIVVDTIECTDAKVVIETSAPGKKPLEFAIRRERLRFVGRSST